MNCSQIRRLLLLGAALPLLSFAADSTLRIDDPYVRLTPPNAPASGAFMLIANDGNENRQLLKAQSPVAKTVELHTHTNDNGVMKMRPVAAIDVKSKGEAVLKPGGLHVMMINLNAPMKEGDVVPITLTFDDGSSKKVDAKVVRPMAAGMPAMEHKH